MTKAEVEKATPKWSDFPKIRLIQRAGEFNHHRARCVRTPGGEYFAYSFVFITDEKVKQPPKAEAPIKLERKFEAPIERAPRVVEEPTEFDAMKQSLRAGVQVVSAPQLFPTPAGLADRVIETAQVEGHHRVLEPSAGTGSLISALAKKDRTQGGSADGEVVAVEISTALTPRLRGHYPYLEIIEGDFLQQNGNLGKFDRVVMNPPFADSQDIAHVRHAYSFLKPGGRLVAIMGEGAFFRQDRKATEFRGWLEEVGGYSEELPAGSFETSGTGVNTRLVVIDVPEVGR